jgi:hypothetical protein
MNPFYGYMEKKHLACKSRSGGADFYLISYCTGWECYHHAAKKTYPLVKHIEGIKLKNLEHDPDAPPLLILEIPEEVSGKVVELLSHHGSVALLQPSGRIGKDKKNIINYVCTIPKVGGAVQEEEEDTDLFGDDEEEEIDLF